MNEQQKNEHSKTEDSSMQPVSEAVTEQVQTEDSSMQPAGEAGTEHAETDGSSLEACSTEHPHPSKPEGSTPEKYGGQPGPAHSASEKEVSWGDVARKISSLFKSMKFGLVILAALIAACIYGSLGNDIYEKPWFLVLALLLCVNILFCSITRFPKLLSAFRKSGCKRFSLWGSWLIHLGILLIVAGFILGQKMTKEYEVYGIAGSTQSIAGTEYTLTIDSFEIGLRDDYTVEQYTAGLTMTNQAGESQSGTANVNHPMQAFGFSLYQDSTGWANYVDIYKDGTLIETDLICVGEYTYPLDNSSLILVLQKFYPDFAESESGGYYSKTPVCNNPVSLYTIYYQNRLLTMNFAEMNKKITVDSYDFVFRDPVAYTLIVINNDPTAVFVGIAALFLLAGIIMAFYLKPIEEKKYASKN